MDLLYAKYKSPLDLIRMYINRGRFGEFVTSVLAEEQQRREREVEREDDWKLWIMYVHMASRGLIYESFNAWKERMMRPAKSGQETQRKGSDEDLTEEGIKSIIDKLFTHDTNRE